MVVQEFLNWFHNMGIVSLFIIMVIEGLSIPFPGLILAITYGHILSPPIEEIMVLAFGMSFTYTLFSYIPYWLGNKLKDKIKKRFERKVKIAQRWFHKYGEWSIILTRLLGIGYISFVAGMSAIKKWKYGLFTFVGIYLWSFSLLYLGQIYKGDSKVVIEIVQLYKNYIFIGIGMIILIIVLVKYRHRKIHHVGKN